ncbi:ABC transporter permease [Anatilimnocola floriformis]|uniref:ABC transporter permease n=1 Tax=Anatilimnocola floriformis TaxID=2948575 RepID=UPI0020C2C8F7|nr:ABC transporter permease [Anatilimnocola floriformis]
MNSVGQSGSGRYRWFTTEVALLIAIALVVSFTALADNKHTYYKRPGPSLQLVAYRASTLGILALGVSVVIIAGGIDLSGGSTIAFSATVCASVYTLLAPNELPLGASAGLLPVGAAIFASLLAGILIGNLHTWLITAIRLPPFIATLATLVGLRSLAHALCEYVNELKGRSGSKLYVNDGFFYYLRDNVWVPVTVFLVLALFTWFVLRRTVLGRHFYALGGNEQATRLSGIRTENLKWAAYCFSAFTGGLAAIFYLADVSSVDPITLARGYELNAIAAAVVGGCSLAGGVGTVSGTVLGVIFLRVVIDAVAKIIKTNSDVWEGFIVGSVVVLAVTLTQIRQLLANGGQLFAGLRGLCAIPTLALTSGIVAMITLGTRTGLIVGGATLLLLVGVKIAEVRSVFARTPRN